jgi:acyl-CoA thioester hydrolase
MTARTVIHTSAIATEWIDFNGHLRDAYYAVIVSDATDRLMDHLGLDAAYRARTQCTLYTLELHMHFLHEVKQPDSLDVAVRIAASDAKRILAAFELYSSAQRDAPVATAEVMLMHVHQGATVASRPFPPEVLARIAALEKTTQAVPAAGPGSRQMQLSQRR